MPFRHYETTSRRCPLPLGLTLSRLPLSLVLLTLSSRTIFAGQSGKASVSPLHLKVVSSTALFVGVNRTELLSTSKLWLETLGKREGLNIVDPEVVLTDNVNEMRTQIDSGTVDLVVSSSLEYLALNRTRILAPEVTLTASSGSGGKISYLILVNKESNIENLAALKGKTINTYSRSASQLNRLWLDVLLSAAQLPAADNYFSSVNPGLRPSTACLPVFFKKSDACLIDSPSWETLRQLNPQIATKLKVLSESQPMVESLVSLTANRQAYRSEMIHSLRGLQDDPEGRQILLLFKCSRVVAITAADLGPLIELRSAYLKNYRPADRKIDLSGAGSGVAGSDNPKLP